MANIEFIIALVILSFLTYIAMRTPSHDRVWANDQKILPSVSTYGEFVTMHNVRQARYRSVQDYDVTYTNTTFRMGDITKVWLLIEPFGNYYPFSFRAAHVLLSFETKHGEHIAISPEIRKKGDETFRPIRTLLPNYEFMYVVADERDVVQLRTTHRKDDVFLYPLNLPPKQTQKLLQRLIEDINILFRHPRFFNTLFRNCTITTLNHLRAVGAMLPRWHISYLFPAHLDALLHQKGLIATKLPLEKARSFFYVTDKAQACGDAQDFSQKIRPPQQKSA